MDECFKNIYLPVDKHTGLFLQQEDYLDKEQLTVLDLAPSVRPINQNWSWDRILRSPFIKQADVLQGLYFLKTILHKTKSKLILIITNPGQFMNLPYRHVYMQYWRAG